MQPAANEVTPAILERENAYHHPSVSILLPLEAADHQGNHFSDRLNIIIASIETELTEKYAKKRVTPVVLKLRELATSYKNDTAKKAVALFVSPLYSKIIYLNFPVEQTVVIDEPYEIRDLIYNEQNKQKYLVLVVCAKHFKVFVGNAQELISVKTVTPDSVEAYKNDIAERVTNFSDVSDRKEVMLDKFLHHIDEELTSMRVTYPYPVILIGAERTAGHFNKLSHNTGNIVKYVHGNYDEATIPELGKLLWHDFASLQTSHEADVVKQLEHAMNEHKLVWGIHEVWRYAMQNKGRMLVVEKNFYFPSTQHGPVIDISEQEKEQENTSYLIDAVDVLIEKVIENGGKVEFVERGLLDNYEHIALAQYY